jgi:hypothetical protein
MMQAVPVCNTVTSCDWDRCTALQEFSCTVILLTVHRVSVLRPGYVHFLIKITKHGTQNFEKKKGNTEIHRIKSTHIITIGFELYVQCPRITAIGKYRSQGNHVAEKDREM